MRTVVEKALLSRYPPDLVKALVDAYSEMQQAYLHAKYKASELEAGLFVEAARRLIELELFGKATPIGRSLPRFDDNELKRYESASGDESYRIHIPRVLRAIYNLRNKRGVGHLSTVSPNLMDATFVMAACSWVLAEFVRLADALPPNQCQQIVDSLTQRRVPLVYTDADIKRVLDPKMSARDQVLVLLYAHGESVRDETLRSWIEYRNKSRFHTNILQALHRERLIEYREGMCKLTPTGAGVAEKILSNRDSWPKPGC